jgi:hypothetical protein
MELRFSMDAVDLKQLTEDIIASRLARHDHTFARLEYYQTRLLAPLTLGLLVLGLVLLPLLLHGRYSMQNGIATLLVLTPMLALWRSHAAPLLQRAVAAGQPRTARIRQRSRERLESSLRRRLSGKLARLQGLHVWRLEELGVLLSTPAGQQRIAWGELECIAESSHFYRLASRTQQRLGLAYAISKHSREMDAATYQAGLAQLIAGCRNTTRRP